MVWERVFYLFAADTDVSSRITSKCETLNPCSPNSILLFLYWFKVVYCALWNSSTTTSKNWAFTKQQMALPKLCHVAGQICWETDLNPQLGFACRGFGEMLLEQINVKDSNQAGLAGRGPVQQ